MNTSSVEDQILAETLRCLRPHIHPEWGDRHAFDIFCRLIAKNVKPQGWTKFTHLGIAAQQIESRRDEWTTKALGELVRGHNDPTGHDFDCPIVIAEYAGTQRVLDGNHRINRWVAAKDQRIHRVNIHTVTGSAIYVELPALPARA